MPLNVQASRSYLDECTNQSDVLYQTTMAILAIKILIKCNINVMTSSACTICRRSLDKVVHLDGVVSACDVHVWQLTGAVPIGTIRVQVKRYVKGVWMCVCMCVYHGRVHVSLCPDEDFT